MDSDLKIYLDAKFAGVIEHIEFRLQTEIGGLEHKMNSRFDQMDQRFVLIEDRIGKLEDRIGKLEERIGKLEERVGRLEERFDRLELRTEERFESVFDHFRVLDRRLDNIEAVLVDVRAQMATLTARVDGAEHRVALVAERMQRLEKGYETLDLRVAGFADDVRQRFRLVNDRLAALAN